MPYCCLFLFAIAVYFDKFADLNANVAESRSDLIILRCSRSIKKLKTNNYEQITYQFCTLNQQRSYALLATLLTATPKILTLDIFS